MSEEPELQVDFDWSMAIDDGALRVEFRVRNRHRRMIYVSDALLISGKEPSTYHRVRDRLVVMEAEPGRASMVFGAAGANNPIGWLIPPVVRPLEAGGSTSASFQLPLPLTPWHYQGWAAPFRTEPKTATLSVEMFIEEPEWYDMPSDTDEPIRVPMGQSARMAIGSPKPIPTP